MLVRLVCATAAAAMIAGCTEPSPQPQPNEMDHLVNATRVDKAAPAGALDDGSGNAGGNYGEGSTTPAERGSIYETANNPAAQAGEVMAGYASLLEQRQFGDAFRFWDASAAGIDRESFVQRFEGYRAIDAAIGRMSGSGGSQLQNVQLTLTVEKANGQPVTMTGPVTLRRTADAGWRITGMKLTSDPQAADRIVDQPTGSY